MLRGRRILLGVSGGVAAYKSVYLCRLLIEAGAEVEVVLSQEAQNFVGAQTFAAVTGRKVVTSLFGQDLVSPHTDLGRWADLVVVAPATAATLSRLAGGASTEVLSAVLLATRAPVVLAPAMHTEMWEHPATRRNLDVLRGDGHIIVGPVSGDLAGGDEGIGRMAEPDEILGVVEEMLAGDFQGVRVLVTAGGTREAIDAVRFIGNRSSGKMGHAVASEAATRGADVTLVTTSDLAAHPSVKLVRVESAEEMAAAVAGIEADVAVMAAAVADFRPARPSDGKLARADGPPDLALEPTPDVLAEVARRSPPPFLVGFAAEAGGLERIAGKAAAKGVDLLVANDVTAPDAGFAVDTNRVTIVFKGGEMEEWPLASKVEIARRLLDLVGGQMGRRR
ncbi:MAG TPA: bifunctional phosphopantothenoylcysteine decarboxylase/phosphopantothenate--cysteine ligase CoaBC [Acidimicrobiia bacterium]|jgi:phosphopantothenoylcysteine decarboxylase/phosphopantothenate--cysteine ligase